MRLRRMAWVPPMAGCCLWLVLPASAAAPVGGTIGSDTTWTNADTIEAIANVTVTSTGHLTIDAGTVVLFDPATCLYVDGQLTASGSEGSLIRFTSVGDTAWGTPTAGSWNGIRFRASGDGSLRHCVVRYADLCISMDRSAPNLDSCVIENFSFAGIYIDGNISSPPITPSIRGCMVGQTDANLRGTAKGIIVYRQADVTITGCEVARCQYGLDFGPYSTYVPHFQITDCVIRDNISIGVYTHAG